MKVLTSILLLTFCMIFSALALDISDPDLMNLTVDRITSPSLEGNLLGDPAERDMVIYLPPSYRTSTKHYPVVYLLHGYTDTEMQLIDTDNPMWEAIKEMGLGDPPDFPANGFAAMMDELIDQGKIQEMILVMPNADNAYGGSWYNNSILTGNYEDYITKDLVSYIDGKYRTIPDRNYRAVAGQSGGGYGAIKLAMRYPDVYGAVASNAGVLSLDLFKATIPITIAENPDGMTGPSPEKIFTSGVYAMSAAFSPNLEKPPFFVDLPFEYPSPEIIKAVWDKYLANDPTSMVATHAENTASLNCIYIDAGDKDEYGANFQTQMYHEALVAAGIDHVFEIFEGGHRNRMFERLGIYLAHISETFEKAQEEKNIATRRLAYEEGFNQGNIDIVDEIYSDKFAGSMEGFSGKDEVKMGMIAYRTAFPDIHFTIDDIFASGDLVVTRISVTGTHEGLFMGVPPTGAKLESTGISIARFADGLIEEVWEENDLLAAAEQLGVLPKMRQAYVWGDPLQVTGDPGTPEANKTIVLRDIEEFWNNQKFNEMDDTYSPDFICHNPNTPGCPTSFAVYKQVASIYLTAFPDLHNTLEDMVASGDKVAVRWKSTGTQKGQLMSIPPTGRKVSWTGITIYRIADGKIAEQWWAYDALGMLQQLTAPPVGYDNVFFMSLSPGLNMISLPLKPIKPYTAQSFAEEVGATMVIKYDEHTGKFVGFVPALPDDGFAIEGGKGYIVNVPKGGAVTFTGAVWTNEPPVDMAPPSTKNEAWAFVVSGKLYNSDMVSYRVVAKNLRTGATVIENVNASGYFTVAWADLNRNAVVKTGDSIEIAITDATGQIVSGPFTHRINPDNIKNATVDLPMQFGKIIPKMSVLLQNYPNPFNPETWIPYHLKDSNPVSISIYSANGQIIRVLDLGLKDAGIYASRSNAAYWDGKNQAGEEVASGIYFYSIKAGDFTSIRKMIVEK